RARGDAARRDPLARAARGRIARRCLTRDGPDRTLPARPIETRICPSMAEHDLDARLALISTGPGVYLLKDAHGKVIHVGQAVTLRARVRSYVRGGDERSQVRFLVGKLADVETLVTSNEKEALILENTLIKQYRPRYNIRLKDDKSYVSVKVTVN